MRRTFITVIFIIVLFCVLNTFSFAAQTGTDTPAVVCTTSVLANFVEGIAQGLLDITTIAPAGMCPAHFDIKPSQLQAVREAKVLISHNFEPWIENLLISADHTDIERLILGGPWNNPPSAIEKIDQIALTLIKQFPQYEQQFTANKEVLIQTINMKSEELKTKIARLNADQLKVIASTHQEPFVQWLGLEIVATFPSPETVSTRKFLELLLTGKKESVGLVVDNLQSGTDLGARLASDLNAKHAILTNFPGLIPQTESLVDMLIYNAEQIFQAIGVTE